MEPENNNQSVEGVGVESNEQATASTETKADNKLYSYLGYIFPFLFFLPLVMSELKQNKFALFHANQQLILLIAIVGLHTIVSTFSSMLMMSFMYSISPLLNLAILVFAVIGIINVSKGQEKELPLIGHFRLL